MGRLSRERRDIYYRRAKIELYRARSAYKLMQIDEEFDLFTYIADDSKRLPVRRVVDLCAAPGSWSQLIRNKLNEKNDDSETSIIVSVDLQEMAPIPGVISVCGDISSNSTAQKIISYFEGGRADLVVCDGAPDVTGMHEVDEQLQYQLLIAALRITLSILRPKGTFVAKCFRGENIMVLYEIMFVFFEEVYCCKPCSSRVSSLESFLVCRNLQVPEDYDLTLDDATSIFEDYIYRKRTSEEARGISSTLPPFISAGTLSDGDPDMTNLIDPTSTNHYTTLKTVQPPINPAYKEAVSTAAAEGSTVIVRTGMVKEEEFR